MLYINTSSWTCGILKISYSYCDNTVRYLIHGFTDTEARLTRKSAIVCLNGINLLVLRIHKCVYVYPFQEMHVGSAAAL